MMGWIILIKFSKPLIVFLRMRYSSFGPSNTNASHNGAIMHKSRRYWLWIMPWRLTAVALNLILESLVKKSATNCDSGSTVFIAKLPSEATLLIDNQLPVLSADHNAEIANSVLHIEPLVFSANKVIQKRLESIDCSQQPMCFDKLALLFTPSNFKYVICIDASTCIAPAEFVRHSKSLLERVSPITADSIRATFSSDMNDFGKTYLKEKVNAYEKKPCHPDCLTCSGPCKSSYISGSSGSQSAYLALPIPQVSPLEHPQVHKLSGSSQDYFDVYGPRTKPAYWTRRRLLVPTTSPPGCIVENGPDCNECTVSNCRACREGEPNECETCSDTYYLEPTNRTCPSCDVSSNCKRCEPNNPAHCTECPTLGVDPNPATFTCTTTVVPPATGGQQCPGGCVRCVEGVCQDQCTPDCFKCAATNITYCERCMTGKLPLDGSRTCVDCVGPQYFINGRTCFPTSICGLTNCEECDPNQQIAGCSRCAAGYSWNASSIACLPSVTCHASCLTCSNATGCVTCIAGLYKSASDPNGICTDCVAPLWFVNSSVCKPCAVDNNCLACDNTGTCSTCKPGYTLRSGNCVQDTTCTGAHYWNSTILSCASCLGSCSSCSDDSSCNVCNNQQNYFKDPNNAGVCTYCPNLLGRFTNTTDPIATCDYCPANCDRCSSKLVCTTCRDGTMKMPDGSCGFSCPTYYYSLNAQCQPCTSRCMACNDTACFSCDANLYVLEGTNTCVACSSPGQFAFDGVCKTCSSSCLTCDTTSTHCTTCRNDSCLYQGACKLQTTIAAESMFAKWQNTQGRSSFYCSACDQNCSTCSGTSTSCTSCKPGFVIVNAICQPCPQSCLNCSVVGQCDVCMAGFSLDAARQCMNCSQKGTFVDSNGSCSTCDASCASCSGSALTCTTCEANKYLTDSATCVACNADNQYLRDTTRCGICSSTCKTCSGTASNCTSCPSALYLTAGGSCVPCIEAGLFVRSSKCVECEGSCKTCSGSEGYCTSCKGGFGLDEKNKCVPCTQAGSSSPDGRCLQCDSSCLTCNGSTSTDCLRCQPGMTLSNEGSCKVLESSLALKSSLFNADKDTAIFVFSDKVETSRTPLADYLSVRLLHSCSAEILKRDLLPTGVLSPTSQCTSTEGWALESINIDNDKLKVELKVSSSIESATLVVISSRSGYFRSANNPNSVYPEDYLIVENVTVIKSALDGMIDTFAGPSAVMSASAQALFMGISASQSVALVKLFQALGYYIYIDCMFPSNFAKFLDMTSQSPFNLMPNLFEGMFDNGGTPDLSRFIQYEWRISFFSNMGEFFTTMIILALIKAIIFGIAKAVAKMRIVNEKFGLDFFVGMFEGIHMELILSVVMFFRDYNDMNMKSDAVKYLVIVFVSLFSLFMISMYLFMGYTVSRLTDSYFKQEHDDFEDMKNEPFKFWVEDKNMHGNIFQRHFNLIQLFKDIVFAALLYALYYKPLVLIILLTLIQAVFMACVFAYPPYNIAWMNNSLKITQCLYMVINLLFGVLAAYGTTMNVKTAYNIVGNMLIGTVVLLVGTNFGFSAYASVKNIKEYCKKNKQAKQRAKLNKVSALANTSAISSDQAEVSIVMMDEHSVTSNSPIRNRVKKRINNAESKLDNGEKKNRTVKKSSVKPLRNSSAQSKAPRVMQAVSRNQSPEMSLKSAITSEKPKSALKFLKKRAMQGSTKRSVSPNKPAARPN